MESSFGQKRIEAINFTTEKEGSYERAMAALEASFKDVGRHYFRISRPRTNPPNCNLKILLKQHCFL